MGKERNSAKATQIVHLNFLPQKKNKSLHIECTNSQQEQIQHATYFSNKRDNKSR